jgi:hypothetical protein
MTQPAGGLKALAQSAGDVLEALQKDGQGQSLTGIAVGGGGVGGELVGQGLGGGTQAVGAAVAGIQDDVAELMVGLESLKQEVPEGDEGSKSPVIEPRPVLGQPMGQEGGGEELAEVVEQLLRGEAGAQGRGGRRWGIKEGVFFDL